MSGPVANVTQPLGWSIDTSLNTSHTNVNEVRRDMIGSGTGVSTLDISPRVIVHDALGMARDNLVSEMRKVNPRITQTGIDKTIETIEKKLQHESRASGQPIPSEVILHAAKSTLAQAAEQKEQKQEYNNTFTNAIILFGRAFLGQPLNMKNMMKPVATEVEDDRSRETSSPDAHHPKAGDKPDQKFVFRTETEEESEFRRRMANGSRPEPRET
jgi:hypothetical protein